jgi:predicted DCC family thiol-disulfide oxidoreductase YuxK
MDDTNNLASSMPDDATEFIAAKPAAGSRPEAATVFYDGACPLCSREIAFYQRRKGADRIDWIDVSGAPGAEVAPGLTRDQALARFHVRNADGTLVSGGAAFAALWTALPGFRYVGKLFQTEPFVPLLEAVYRIFLRVRPRLQNTLLARRSAG